MREKKVEEYDVVVIGGGASGLTAAIYCGRAKLKTLLIEKALIGGLATYTNEIENYPGFPEGTGGLDLMNLFKKQAQKFEVKIKLTDVKSVDLSGDVKKVETFRNTFEAKTVIVAAGGRPGRRARKTRRSFSLTRESPSAPPVTPPPTRTKRSWLSDQATLRSKRACSSRSLPRK
jgi:thioredoxin reductase (NADPH)